MMPKYYIKQIRTFELKTLHKKVGRILVLEPTDSDIQEGDTETQVWFVDDEGNMYLLMGKDVNKQP